jgi:hypothetical protein
MDFAIAADEIKPILAFNLVDDNLNFTTSALPVLSYELTNDIKILNSSEVLSFELRDYHERLIVFQIVLDFIMETGGIF